MDKETVKELVCPFRAVAYNSLSKCEGDRCMAWRNGDCVLISKNIKELPNDLQAK